MRSNLSTHSVMWTRSRRTPSVKQNGILSDTKFADSLTLDLPPDGRATSSIVYKCPHLLCPAIIASTDQYTLERVFLCFCWGRHISFSLRFFFLLDVQWGLCSGDFCSLWALRAKHLPNDRMSVEDQTQETEKDPNYTELQDPATPEAVVLLCLQIYEVPKSFSSLVSSVSTVLTMHFLSVATRTAPASVESTSLFCIAIADTWAPLTFAL